MTIGQAGVYKQKFLEKFQKGKNVAISLSFPCSRATAYYTAYTARTLK